MDGEKCVPRLRFPEFVDSWQQRKLSECAGFRRGSFPQPYGNKEWYDGDGAMPFVQVADVADDMKLVDNTKQKISKIAQPMSVYADKGSVIVTLQGSIGRVAVTQYDAFVDRTVLLFYKYNQDIDKTFWAYIVKKVFVEKAKQAPGGTIKTITKEVLSDFEVMIPSFEEQKKLAAFCDNLETFINLYQRKVSCIKEFKSGVLQKMFPRDGESVPEIRFPGFTEDWEQRKVQDIYKITRGYVLAAPETVETASDEMPYPVFSSQTKNNGLMGYYKDYLYENAITWTTDGANAGTVNYRAGKFYCTNVCGVLLSDGGYSNKCAAEALNNVAWKWVSHVGNPKLMNNVMGEIPITLPKSIEEQNQISEIFEQIDNLITLHRRKLEKMMEYKRGLFQQMFV